jgi:hypothetical protein
MSSLLEDLFMDQACRLSKNSQFTRVLVGEIAEPNAMRAAS